MAKSKAPIRLTQTSRASVPVAPSATSRRLNQFDRKAQAATANSAQAATAQAEAIRAETYRMSGISQAMLDLQAHLTEQYTSAQNATGPTAQTVTSGLVGAENNNGSYIGLIEKKDRVTGEIGVVLTVRTKHDLNEIAPQFVIPESESVRGEKIRVDVRAVGTPIAQQGYRVREIPALYGASIGLASLGATGTLGCLVATSDNDLCILSNNHVLADLNRAALGSEVIQPGNADGGTQGIIGHLKKFHPMNLVNSGQSFPNQIDAALAITSFKDCIPGLHGDLPFVGSTRAASVRLPVIKQGRTTDHTEGRVIGLNASLTVGYGPSNNPAPFGSFTDQIVVEGMNGPFSRAGDSGSVIFGFFDGVFHPIGLLFAGGTDNAGRVVTWANPIDIVMQTMGIDQILDPSYPID